MRLWAYKSKRLRIIRGHPISLPQSVDAYNNRGLAYAALGTYKQAIVDYNKAIEINPKYAEAYFDRGFAYSALGNHKQVIEDYNRAIEINPNYAHAYFNRAASYEKLGNHKQVFEDMKTSAALGYEPAQNYLRSRGMSW